MIIFNLIFPLIAFDWYFIIPIINFIIPINKSINKTLINCHNDLSTIGT